MYGVLYYFRGSPMGLHKLTFAHSVMGWAYFLQQDSLLRLLPVSLIVSLFKNYRATIVQQI